MTYKLYDEVHEIPLETLMGMGCADIKESYSSEVMLVAGTSKLGCLKQAVAPRDKGSVPAFDKYSLEARLSQMGIIEDNGHPVNWVLLADDEIVYAVHEDLAIQVKPGEAEEKAYAAALADLFQVTGIQPERFIDYLQSL